MAKTTKDGFQVTKDLQETVKKNQNIKVVYFDKDGNHYFTKHKVKIHTVDEMNVSIGSEEVDALPGAKRGLVKVTQMINGRPTLKDAFTNIDYTPIAGQMTRDEVLNAEPVSSSLSDKEKLEILTKAAEIAKGGDLDGLLEKLKESKK